MSTESMILNEQIFEWDKQKNIANIKKHGVSFKIAALAFFDPSSTLLDDAGHSYDEERFILVGFSKGASLLTVCHCYRDDGDVVRIISARSATREEQELYGGYYD